MEGLNVGGFLLFYRHGAHWFRFFLNRLQLSLSHSDELIGSLRMGSDEFYVNN